jgi:hypothetical protein
VWRVWALQRASAWTCQTEAVVEDTNVAGHLKALRCRATSSGPTQRAEKAGSPLARPMTAQAFRNEKWSALAATDDQPALEAGEIYAQRARV